VRARPSFKPPAESPATTGRPGSGPACCQTAVDAEIRGLRARIADGSPLEAAARVLVYIGKARHCVDERTFEAMRRLLLAHAEVSRADFKEILREQRAIVTIDERAAIEALPQPPDRRRSLPSLSRRHQRPCRDRWRPRH